MTGCSFHGFLLQCAVHLEAREAFSGCICAKIQMAADGCAGADMSSGTFWKKEKFYYTWKIYAKC